MEMLLNHKYTGIFLLVLVTGITLCNVSSPAFNPLTLLNLSLFCLFIWLIYQHYFQVNLSTAESKKLDALSLALNQQKFALDQHSIVAITDIKGTITYINDKFIQISEYSHHELIGNNHRILNSKHHPADFFRNMYLTISAGDVWKGEICNRAKSGRIYWVDTTIVPFKNNKGIISSYIAIRTDITDRKENEAALLREKNKAESAALAKSEFLANMSHEIRTPMNGVLGMLNILEKSTLSTQQFNQLKLAKHSGNALLSIINDILDFSKVDAGKLEIENIKFNLKELFDNVVTSHSLKAEEKEIELIVDTSLITISHVVGDPSRLSQIINNLIGNALKFTQQGEVIIKAALQDSGEFGLILYCSVNDTGIGIPLNKQHSLFEKFTQVDSSTTREYGGTGLGLSITKHLCELMGGSIALGSKEGQGSRFNFSIQLQKCEEESAVVAPPLDLSTSTILIVDDNKSNRECLQLQLQAWGANVLLAKDASEALSMLESSQENPHRTIKLAIIDLNMPGMNGLELGENIRKEPELFDINLILMTSINYHGDDRDFAKKGFQAFFTKPATTDDLLKAASIINQKPQTLDQSQPLITSHNIQNLKLATPISFNSSNHPQEQSPEKNILLVEDNLINQEVAKELLEEFNCNLSIANNGEEALKILKNIETKIDVVLMDCQMPVMDGYQATQEIRNGICGDEYKNIPIIAMTANALKGDREKCITAGMNDYISKPVDPELLKEKLQL